MFATSEGGHILGTLTLRGAHPPDPYLTQFSQSLRKIPSWLWDRKGKCNHLSTQPFSNSSHYPRKRLSEPFQDVWEELYLTCTKPLQLFVLSPMWWENRVNRGRHSRKLKTLQLEKGDKETRR